MHKVSDAVRRTHGQDGAIVLDAQQGEMFSLNLVGSRMLELLAQGSTEPEIVNVISREFRVNPQVVEKDLIEFIETLTNYKLVEDQKSGGTA
jgi:hypothetical protein